MSAIQMTISRTFEAFPAIRLQRLSERFLNWWVSLYTERRTPPSGWL